MTDRFFVNVFLRVLGQCTTPYIIIIYKLPGLVGINILLKVSHYFYKKYTFYEVTLTLRLSAIHNTILPAIYGLSLEEVFDST